MKRRINVDKLLTALAITYIIIPIILFLLTWTKLIIGIPCSAILLILGTKIYKRMTETSSIVTLQTLKNHKIFCISTLIILAIWVYLSGITGTVYQNWDYWARNALLNDLSTYNYPIIYDLSNQPQAVQSITGSDKVALAYYITWWLPVTTITKTFGLDRSIVNILLYIYLYIGVSISMYLICRYFKKATLLIPIVFIFFSGLDIIPALILYEDKITPLHHLDGWNVAFNYLSFTQDLFWAFNQTVPFWIIASLSLNMKDTKYKAGWTSLMFAYSPWVTIGLVPYIVYDSFKNKESIKKSFNIVNILPVSTMLFTYGTYYLTSSGSSSKYTGLILIPYAQYGTNIFLEFLLMYILFIAFEYSIYFIIMGKSARQYKYYLITIASLILYCTVIINGDNFALRASYTPLFIMYTYIIKYLLDYKNKDILRLIGLIIALVIGSLTAFNELCITTYNTIKGEYLEFNPVESLGNINESSIYGDVQYGEYNYPETIRKQFYAYDYENTTFFKYIAKQTK
jgi:hypothetical protein